MSVWDPHPDYRENLTAMQLARDLLGGTSAMRGDDPSRSKRGYAYGGPSGFHGATPWIMRMSSDSDESYRERWDRAYLFGAFDDAVHRIAAKAFSESLQVEGVEGRIERIVHDADRAGCSLHTFAHGHFARKIAFGGSGVMVSMPSVGDLPVDAENPSAPGYVHELAKERYDVRPYLRTVHRLSIVDWQWGGTAGRERALTYLAIREDDETRREDGKHVVYEHLRTWQVDGGKVVERHFERRTGASTDADVIAAEVPKSETVLSIAMIPFVWDSVLDPGKGDDPFAVGLPMDELAWLNLQHMRETAELGVALLTSKAEGAIEFGCPEADLGMPLTWGLRRAKRTMSRPDEYDIQFRGPEAKGVELGFRSLEQIESRMERLGSQPLVRQSGNATATGRKMDESKAETMAAAWARGTEDAIQQALRIADLLENPGAAAPRLDMRLPGAKVSIRGLAVLDAAEREAKAKMTVTLFELGVLAARRLLMVFQELRYLPEDWDLDEMADEVAEIEAEKAAASLKLLSVIENQSPPEPDPDQDPEADAGRRKAPATQVA